jgi:D-alanyl-D-alanine carboxypeptidase (penicillin-binding protein 5/6)
MANITHSALRYKSGVQKKRFKTSYLVFVLIVVFFGTGSAYRISAAPVTTPNTTSELSFQDTRTTTLLWPTYGQSALAIKGSGVVDTNKKNQLPQPTASTAKLITMLAVIKKAPLNLDDPGPMITVSDQDIALYNDYFQKNGSQIKLELGQQISQYDAMQAVLLASANNVADMLAVWAFGSLESYSDYANSMLKSMGINNTTVGKDASGFDPSTVSTASDLALIGLAAAQNSIIASITRKQEAILPQVGIIRNTNFLLSESPEFIGLKTGNTDQAGGVFVLLGETSVDNQKLTIVSVCMGAPNTKTATVDSRVLYEQAKKHLRKVEILPGDSVVTNISPYWLDSPVDIINRDPLQALIWPGSASSIHATIQSIQSPVDTLTQIGNLEVQQVDGTISGTPLFVQKNIPSPSIVDKLLQ